MQAAISTITRLSGVSWEQEAATQNKNLYQTVELWRTNVKKVTKHDFGEYGGVPLLEPRIRSLSLCFEHDVRLSVCLSVCNVGGLRSQIVGYAATWAHFLADIRNEFFAVKKFKMAVVQNRLFHTTNIYGLSILREVLEMLCCTEAIEAPAEQSTKYRVRAARQRGVDEIRRLATQLCDARRPPARASRRSNADEATAGSVPPGLDPAAGAAAARILLEFQGEVLYAVQELGWDGSDDVTESELQWSFAGALLYAVTVITTIGTSTSPAHRVKYSI